MEELQVEFSFDTSLPNDYKFDHFLIKTLEKTIKDKLLEVSGVKWSGNAVHVDAH